MKKILALALAVSLVSFAGSAIASGHGHGRYNDGYGYNGHRQSRMMDCPIMQNGCIQQNDNQCPMMAQNCNFGDRQHRMDWMGHRGQWNGINSSNMPDEIKAKFEEMQKVSSELMTELQKRPLDKDKVMSLYNSKNTLQQEISNWRFNQYVDSLK